MSKSQEQPAMNAAAAGGNRMATKMSKTSDPLTIVAYCCRVSEDGAGWDVVRVLGECLYSD